MKGVCQEGYNYIRRDKVYDKFSASSVPIACRISSIINNTKPAADKSCNTPWPVAQDFIVKSNEDDTQLITFNDLDKASLHERHQDPENLTQRFYASYSAKHDAYHVHSVSEQGFVWQFVIDEKTKVGKMILAFRDPDNKFQLFRKTEEGAIWSLHYADQFECKAFRGFKSSEKKGTYPVQVVTVRRCQNYPHMLP